MLKELASFIGLGGERKSDIITTNYFLNELPQPARIYLFQLKQKGQEISVEDFYAALSDFPGVTETQFFNAAVGLFGSSQKIFGEAEGEGGHIVCQTCKIAIAMTTVDDYILCPNKGCDSNKP